MHVKKCFLLLTLFCILSNAQVGIGTTSPNAQLEIVSTTNGLLIPRVALSSKAVSAPVVNPNGGGAPADATLVYNTATVVSGADSVAPGFYYYSATSSRWIPMNNIYTSNGTLEDNRTVTQGANKLAFTASEVNAFSVDGSTFSVDAANQRVGIGTNVPSYKLHVRGDTNIKGELRLESPTTGFYAGFIKGDDDPVSDNTKLIIQSARGVGGIIFNTNNGSTVIEAARITNVGRIGIGLTNPQYKFDVLGDANVRGQLRIDSADGNDAGYITASEEAAGANKLIIQSNRGGGAIIFGTNNGSNVEAARITNVGNFGLGIAAPTSTFHNNGTTSFTVSPVSSSATDTTVLLRNTNVTLPTAAAGNAGRMYIIRNTNTSGNISVSSIIGYGASTAGSFSLTSAIGSISVISDGTNWYRID